MIPLTFSLREVEEMLGVSRPTLRQQINQKKLAAYRKPGRTPNPRHWKYRISREDLVTWMVQGGMDLRLLRGVLNTPGLLLLVRTEPALQTCLSSTPTRGVPSLFHLGRQVMREPAWGAVIDLPAVGTTDACRTLAPYAKEADRPELIGLVGDDVPAETRRLLAETFDVVIPKGLAPQAQARSIMRLCPTRPGRNPP